MRLSLHRRLLVWVAASSGLTLLVLLLSTCFLVESQLWQQFDDALQSRLNNLTQLIEQKGGQIEFEWDEPEADVSPLATEGERMTCWKQGKVLHVYPSDAAPLKHPPHGSTIRTVSLGNRPARVASLVFTPRREDVEAETAPIELTLALATPISGILSTIRILRWSLVVSTMIGLCLILGATRFAVSRGLAPLAAVTAEMANVSPTNLQGIASLDRRPEELRPLLSTLNNLFDRLALAMQRERALSAEIAHELRTPMAGLRAKFDVVLSRPRSAAEYRSTLEQCDDIVRRTTVMVETLLATVASENASTGSHRVNLSQCIERTLLEFENAANHRNIEFAPTIRPGVGILADEQRIRIVIRNLIENAVHYADPGSTVTVDCAVDNDRAVVGIRNSARDFQPEQLDRIFERFWRGDSSRSATGTHAGLGLPLTKRIVNQTGGTISADFHNGDLLLALQWKAAGSPTGTEQQASSPTRTGST